jgi:hypothetical protein
MEGFLLVSFVLLLILGRSALSAGRAIHGTNGGSATATIGRVLSWLLAGALVDSGDETAFMQCVRE